MLPPNPLLTYVLTCVQPCLPQPDVLARGAFAREPSALSPALALIFALAAAADTAAAGGEAVGGAAAGGTPSTCAAALAPSAVPRGGRAPLGIPFPPPLGITFPIPLGIHFPPPERRAKALSRGGVPSGEMLLRAASGESAWLGFGLGEGWG